MENRQNKDKILEVKDLRISFRTNGGTVKAVRGISFSLYRGRTLAIVGESGSGKSVTSKAILGILANNKIIEGGQIIYDGQDLLKIDEDHFHKIRGVKISMIFQDPLSSLNPIMIVGKQLTEAMVLKQKADKKEARHDISRIKKMLHDANFEEPSYLAYEKSLSKKEDVHSIDLTPFFEKILDKDLERRAAAIAKVLPALRQIVEESFLGEDTNIEETIRKIYPLFRTIKECSLHSLGSKDNTVEVFPAVLKNIKEMYRVSLKIQKDIDKAYKKFNVSDFFALPPSERAKLPEVVKTHKDQVAELKETINELIAHLEELEQEGTSKKDLYVQEVLKEYDEANEKLLHTETSAEIRERAIQMLREVGIDEPERRFKQYPFELSGGMRQRIVIAIALCSSPEILICDEPTTALDVTIQAQILELINKLKRERNLSIVFITHDLGVVANMADDIAVMYAGKIVEYGKDTEIFYDPRHPYTWALLGSMPDLNTKEQLSAIPGTPPNMLLPPKGDAFAPRNAHALAIDQEMQPPFFEVSPTHFAATWNLHPEAPDLHAPEIVVTRIKEALEKTPEATPTPTNMKNSILNELGKEKKSNGRKKNERN